MGSTSEESSGGWDTQDSSGREEKIFVSVRLRPLSEKELGKDDVSDWECINNTTIIYKNSPQERSMLPAAYTFDGVFGSHCPTRQVYEEAAKKIALSVLSGINACIFAYGQTSSGKTYTMSGITEYAVADIYDYVENHSETEFVLKFSALEIYNEVVRDLLGSDGAPLRLLDDAVRGTVVEKLTEVEVRDFGHLQELLSICQAQRKIGETNLNEKSSRSHQILCLTVESEARKSFRTENASTLTASVSFVDLAGSERASQTSSAGTRLKEGFHINRSLLTLGTVIRKLSKGRNGHIPFRDSKLTRILQHSLAGNARTAVMCTMSPAHSHVEQSKSTLVFATCAKQVSTNAPVNVKMSEKDLVKHLLREVARLENEVRKLSSLATSGESASALKEKELIEQLKQEIRQLTHQHNLSQSSSEDFLPSGRASRASISGVAFHNHEKGSWTDKHSASEASVILDPLYFDVLSRTSHFSGVSSSCIEDQHLLNYEDRFLSDDTSPRLFIDKYFGPVSPDPGWENIAQESGNEFEGDLEDVQCIEIDFTKKNTDAITSSTHKGDENSGSPSCSSDEDESDPSANVSSNRSLSEVAEENGNTSRSEAENQGKRSNVEPEANTENLQTEDSTSIDFKKEKEENIWAASEGCKVKQQEYHIAELNEVMRKLAKQFEGDSGLEYRRTPKNLEKSGDGGSDKDQDEESASAWHATFERQKIEIIELWAVCNVPLIYRTYFFMLFNGDPSDSVYLEVELRRLSFLKKKLQGRRVVKDDQFFTEAASAKALNRERDMLSRQMLKKFTGRERKALYQQWGINLKSKRRRLQLCGLLWTDSSNMEHIKDSAAIVAKLVGFKERGNAPKEMIGLNFLQKPENLSCFSWRHSLPSVI